MHKAAVILILGIQQRQDVGVARSRVRVLVLDVVGRLHANLDVAVNAKGKVDESKTKSARDEAVHATLLESKPRVKYGEARAWLDTRPGPRCVYGSYHEIARSDGDGRVHRRQPTAGTVTAQSAEPAQHPASLYAA